MARLIGTVLLALVLSPLVASAQLPAADAGAFLGKWALTLDGPQGAFEQSVVVKDEAGKVVAEISNEMQPEVQKVTDVSKDKDSLVMKFAGNFQGQAFDATITMTPDGSDKAKVLFDINGGQFSMSGTGVKK